MSNLFADAERLLVDCQHRWQRLTPTERHRALGQLLQGANALAMGPLGVIAGGTQFAIGHRAHLQAIEHALSASIPLTTRLLQRQLGEFDVAALWPMLRDLAFEAGKYIGGGAVAGALLGGGLTLGAGTLPGAVVGAEAGLWVYNAVGIVKLVGDLPNLFTQLCGPYYNACCSAWAVAELGHRDPIQHSLLTAQAAREFAAGHALMVTLLLATLATYLLHNAARRLPLFKALAEGRLGPKFARWVEENQAALTRSQRLKPNKPVVQQLQEEMQQRERAQAGQRRAGNSGKVKPSSASHDARTATDPQSRSSAKSSPAAKSTASSERNLGTNSGHQYAQEVLPGGSGTAYAGHGEYTYGSGVAIVPKGTAITLPRPGIKILDETGRYIEAGDWEGLAKAAQRNPRIANDIEGMATHLPGAEVPNYTLSAPSRLKILQESTTVESRTHLDSLLKADSGCVEWAACTAYSR